MAQKQVHHTLAEIEKALHISRGLLLPAAESLGITREAVRLRVNRSARLQETVREARDGLLDRSEQRLADAVNAGEPWAVQFTLRTLGRDRGYAERVEHSGPSGSAITLKFDRAGADVAGD